MNVSNGQESDKNESNFKLRKFKSVDVDTLDDVDNTDVGFNVVVSAVLPSDLVLPVDGITLFIVVGNVIGVLEIRVNTVNPFPASELVEVTVIGNALAL